MSTTNEAERDAGNRSFARAALAWAFVLLDLCCGKSVNRNPVDEKLKSTDRRNEHAKFATDK